MALRSLITSPVMNRVVNYALDGLAALGLDRVGDFHAPGRPQLGDLEDDGSSIFGERGTLVIRAGCSS